MVLRVRRVLIAAVVLVSACSLGGEGTATSTTSPASSTSTSLTTTTTVPTTTTIPATTTTVDPFARPDWMGTRVLPLRPDGYGEVQPTPPEFDPRALETPDDLPAAHRRGIPLHDSVPSRPTCWPGPVGCPSAR